jgi:O-antigen/teichoic acid export membrane protein
LVVADSDASAVNLLISLKMSLRQQAVKNVSATWLGLFVHALTGLFLSPFILHKLGDQAFSLWVLVFSLTGYFGLLDLGIRSSIVKYTAKFIATGDMDSLGRYLSTSMAFYSAIGVVVLLGTVAGYFYLHSLFRIPVELLPSARLLVLLSGAGIAMTFPLTVFVAALEGLQKFSWLQLSQIGIALLRALLIVVALLKGGGLLAVGTITAAMGVISYLVFACVALYALPVRPTLRHVDFKAFREMAGYGVFAFAILAAEKLRFQSDPLVIGALVSSTAIATFSIAAKLVEYSSYAVRSMSQIFTPLASQFDATGDLARLRRTLIAGNRASAFIILPICVALIIAGRSVIEAWVGPRYVNSYSILVLLIMPRTLYLAQSTSIRVLLGMGRHRVLASVLLLEGGANLLLSVLLARRFGIIGVAWGTAIPLACTSLFFLPRHVCRVLDVRLSTFLKSAYRLPLTLAAVQAVVLLAINYEFGIHGYVGLLLQVAGLGAVYFVYAGWVLFKSGLPRPRTWHAFSQLMEPK